jgi:hypothetical protein
VDPALADSRRHVRDDAPYVTPRMKHSHSRHRRCVGSSFVAPGDFRRRDAWPC